MNETVGARLLSGAHIGRVLSAHGVLWRIVGVHQYTAGISLDIQDPDVENWKTIMPSRVIEYEVTDVVMLQNV